MEVTSIVVQCLVDQGVDLMFGVVGIPVTPIAEEAQKKGIRFYGFRNEQAASYAASVVGYLTGRPAVLLTVAGPGMIHGLGGVCNATSSGWPLIVISAAGDSTLKGKGAFQETRQLDAAAIYAKSAARVDHARQIPAFIEQAARLSVYGTPGACYIEIPADIVNGHIPEDEAKALRFPPHYPLRPISIAPPSEIKKVLDLIAGAKRPLLIVGEGAAYARAEEILLQFVRATNLPVISSPMGKGVIPEDEPHVVAAARSLALAQADVVVTVGARLNWMFAYGTAPTFAPDVQFIQIDSQAENINHNVHSTLSICADISAVISQLLAETGGEGQFEGRANLKGEWWTSLLKKAEENTKRAEAQCANDKVPLGYHYVLNQIKKRLPRNTVIVNEGANTMDFGRLILPNYGARQRLDAGILSAMGLGVGYAIAAAAVHGDSHPVVAIQGDSAFGFSGMEIEVACRYQLPIVFIVLNNNGIYKGVDELPSNMNTITSGLEVSPSVFVPRARYDVIMEAFGGKGYFVSTPGELSDALEGVFESPKRHEGGRPCLINIMITTEGPVPKIVQREQKA